ncbi:hypothetical protein ABZ760_27485 [Streptomyces sp. NPDC006658]|uniref:hypothetical protein n=1 Tax=Streptomyces sp. NPDC006658 TaxID=3156900 RepID=UPI0033DC08CB
MSEFDQRNQSIHTQTNNYYTAPPFPPVPPGPPPGPGRGNRRRWTIAAAAVTVVAAACAVAYVQAGNGDSSRTPSNEASGGTPRQPPAHTAPVVNATPSRSTPSPTPSASSSALAEYAVERTGKLRFTAPDDYFVVDFDTQPWVVPLTNDQYSELTDEEKEHHELDYRNPLWGYLEPAGRRATGILAPGQAATADSCREAAGTAPLSSTQMEDVARARTNGVVEGATLCTVTDQGRIVASKVTAIDRPGTAHAPVLGMDVTVWGAKG